jgi:DNA-binding MarR family transcriptional regulator
MLSIMATGSTSTAIKTGELASQLRLGVMRLARRLRQHAPEDITQSQLSALAVLVRDGEHTSTQLATAERVQPPTITRIVDTLVAKGLATRTVDDADRRVVWIAPTAEGRTLVDTTRRRRDAYLARHLRTLSPDEVELLARAAVLLERLTKDPVP